jgi:hypothetical protein
MELFWPVIMRIGTTATQRFVFILEKQGNMGDLFSGIYMGFPREE